MSRRVQTTQYQATGGAAAADDYFDKIVKYIPSDIVAAWAAIAALLKGASGIPTNTVLWILFTIFVALTVWWTWSQTNEPAKPTATKQIVISALAFIVWVFALGAPFDTLAWYHTTYASIALIIFTLVIGKINPE